MPDYLDTLARDAIETVNDDYYEIDSKADFYPVSLKDSIKRCPRAPIISEIKYTSPSEGTLRKDTPLLSIIRDMEDAGVAGISILTEPKHFKGDIKFICEARSVVKTPILMKDIVVDPLQIEAASKMGANAVLLIMTIFQRGYCKNNVKEMVEKAHSKGLEVLLEAHTEEEFLSALKTNADIIGINNRDLKTLEVDLRITKHILTKHPVNEEVIISESGVKNSKDIRILSQYGVKGFLVGSAIMKADNIKEKIKELVNAL